MFPWQQEFDSHVFGKFVFLPLNEITFIGMTFTFLAISVSLLVLINFESIWTVFKRF